MRLVVAVIPPACLESVKAALGNVEVFRITVSEVQGFSAVASSNADAPETFRTHDRAIPMVRYIQLMIGVNEHFLKPTLEAIQRSVQQGPRDTGEDGKVFVVPLDDCIRIRTGERGGEAI